MSEHPKRIRCKCGRIVRDTFKGKWRHMVNYHPDHLAKKILPLMFAPPEQLMQIGRSVAGAFVRKLVAHD